MGEYRLSYGLAMEELWRMQLGTAKDAGADVDKQLAVRSWQLVKFGL